MSREQDLNTCMRQRGDHDIEVIHGLLVLSEISVPLTSLVLCMPSANLRRPSAMECSAMDAFSDCQLTEPLVRGNID